MTRTEKPNGSLDTERLGENDTSFWLAQRNFVVAP